jgi:hypothetical protein
VLYQVTAEKYVTSSQPNTMGVGPWMTQDEAVLTTRLIHRSYHCTLLLLSFVTTLAKVDAAHMGKAIIKQGPRVRFFCSCFEVRCVRPAIRISTHSKSHTRAATQSGETSVQASARPGVITARKLSQRSADPRPGSKEEVRNAHATSRASSLSESPPLRLVFRRSG